MPALDGPPLQFNFPFNVNWGGVDANGVPNPGYSARSTDFMLGLRKYVSPKWVAFTGLTYLGKASTDNPRRTAKVAATSIRVTIDCARTTPSTPRITVKVSSGYTQAVEAMRDAAANESMRLEHLLSYVGLIGALAPMIGLLGTVWGMVKSFMEIAASTTSPKPAKLAEGISTALITTLIGLVIAIVAVAVFAFFKNRLQSLNAAVDDEAMKVMSRFSKRSSQATPSATA